MSTIIKTKLYRDFNFSQVFDNGDEFEVEFVGDKARVHTNTLFTTTRVSKLSKLHMIGSSTGGSKPGKYMYSLTVNGQKVFMIVEHKIPSAF